LVAAAGFGFAAPAHAVNSPAAAISAQTELGGEFPDNCLSPLGWTTPGGATTGWTVDLFDARSGSCSLRSQPMGNSGSGFNKAQIQVTGQFTSSALRFAAKVSSEQPFDCLRVFIDGVEQNVGGRCSGNGGLGISGEIDWAVHTIPLPDGAHTIVWSYEKNTSIGSGSDAAWIDDVEIVPVFSVFPNPCAVPAGWVKPAAATAGWVAVAETVGSGPCSLKSSPIPDFGKAQIELTSVFEAGTISFARRVSSESTYDCLKFFIDGAEQNVGAQCANNGGLGVSGNATWDTVEIPITAGLHTIRWSYEKDVTVSSGSDAAWIDNVVLPPNARPPGAPLLDFVSRDTEGNASFSASPPTDNGGSPIVEYILQWRQQSSGTIEGQQSYFFLPATLNISGLSSHGPYVVSLRARNDFTEGPAAEVNTGNDACGAPAEGYSVASASFDANGGLAFAARPVGGSSSVSVTVTNNDFFNARVYLTIDSAGDFGSSNLYDCEDMGPAPSSTCTVTINFSPQAAGPRTGTFTVDGPAKLRCNREVTPYTLTGAGVALNQTITFGALGNKSFGDAAFTVSASASSGLPVSFSSLTPSVCTVAATTVSLAGAGTCTIAANQAGDGAYNAAPQVTQSFTVAKGNQAITFDVLANKAVNQTPFTVSATASSQLAVAFSSLTTPVCTVAGTSVTLLTIGTCTIAANQAGNANYNAAAQVTRSFSVTKASQAITFNALASRPVLPSPFTISATASSGLATAFSSLTTGTCTVSGTTVTLVATGVCTIAANQAGNATYDPAPQVTQSFTIGKAGQSITFAALANWPLIQPPFTVSATASSGLSVAFSSLTPSICTVSGATVTLVAAGTCTIAANQGGNATYEAAPQVARSFTVTTANQAITFNSLPSRPHDQPPFTISATASSGLAVVFTSLTPWTCTVSGATVTLVGTGNCTIAANQPGNATYDPAAQVTQSFTVGKVSQVIAFGALASRTINESPVTVSATASSGLAVSFSSLTTAICTTSGTTVTLVAAGTCTIAANQAGSAAYDAAPQVTQSFEVTAPANPSRLFNISTRGQVLGGPEVMIPGFVIIGTSPKSVVVTVKGPSLTALGVPGALADPTLQLVRSSDQTTIATNDNWGDAPNKQALVDSGFAPGNPLEPAILANLPQGAYTAIVSGANGTTGVGLVEVYEVDRPDVPLANISTRGWVGAGGDVMIGGFVILGDGPQTVAIAVKGPSLGQFGIQNALAYPQFTLVRSSDQVAIASNDNWGDAPNKQDLFNSGFAPGNPLEPALLVTLGPGAYTVIVSGVANSGGVALLEIYALD
jgi:hypothetical protein